MAKILLPNRPLGPFPTVLVGAMVEGRPNYLTVGACGVVCLDPVIYVSLKSTHYTTQGVLESGFFSINIPSTAQVAQTDFCGMHSGRDTDKGKLFTPFYDEHHAVPMIEECPVNLVCKVFQHLSIRGFDMFFGDIVAMYGDNTCLSAGQPDPLKVNPMVMMGSHYLSLDKPIGGLFQAGKGLASTASD